MFADILFVMKQMRNLDVHSKFRSLINNVIFYLIIIDKCVSYVFYIHSVVSCHVSTSHL